MQYVCITNHDRGMEQLVARRAHNPKVTGSSPVPATKKSRVITRLFYLSIFQINRYRIPSLL